MRLAIPGGGDFSDLQIDVERLEAAERDRRRTKFLAALRVATPALLNAAEAIESGWLDLTPEVQASMIRTKGLFDEQSRTARPLPSNPIELFKQFTMAISALVYEAEIRSYMIASVRFVLAVSRALADEARQRRAVALLEADDEDAQKAIAIGQSEYENRSGHRYTKDEFLHRFSLK